MSILLKIKKCIYKTTFILRSVNKNVISKNQAFSGLFSIRKLAIIILNISNIKLSILGILTLVERIFRPSFDIYLGVIVLISFPKLNRAQTWTSFF